MVFLAEVLIFVSATGIMIPLLSRVREISRKLFKFMLLIDQEDVQQVIRRTKRFIKVYIEKDIILEDSLIQYTNLDSSNLQSIFSEQGQDTLKDMSF